MESEDRMSVSPRLVLVLAWLVVSLAGVGCGDKGDQPELGRVRGTVTLDEKPLAGVNVTFFPDKGRAAAATTDSAGKYDLIYAPGVNGAKLGPNTVNIAWPDGQPGARPIPAKYGAQSELKADVKAGKNTCDFSLKSP